MKRLREGKIYNETDMEFYAKQMQIEVLEKVQDCFNEIVSFEDDLDEIVGVFNKQLEQRIKELRNEASG